MKSSKQLWKIIFKLEEVFLKLKYPFCKTMTTQMVLSYTGPTIWSKTHDMLKQTNNVNAFKHNLKEHCLKKLKNLILISSLS